MSFSSLQQLKLTHLLHLGFGLVLLCMLVTLGANLVANTQHQTITDRLIDHLYHARKSANEIIRLALTIDDDGAWYVLSHNPHQRAQLLQTYQQDVQALQVETRPFDGRGVGADEETFYRRCGSDQSYPIRPSPGSGDPSSS